MNFEVLGLPESVPSEGLTPRVKRALKIYNQVDSSGYYDLDKRSAQNEVLDMFDPRVAYIASDEDQIIQGVANYYVERNNGWIEGIATTSRKLHIGSFIVANLIDLANSQGLQAIELRSTQDALGFWVKQGFDVTGKNAKNQHIGMRLEL